MRSTEPPFGRGRHSLSQVSVHDQDDLELPAWSLVVLFVDQVEDFSSAQIPCAWRMGVTVSTETRHGKMPSEYTVHQRFVFAFYINLFYNRTEEGVGDTEFP